MTTRPLVSIVMPSLNQGRFIREAIDSVLAQTYPNIQLVVVDGGSRDETVEILRSYGDRIHWTTGKDRNVADAINKGVARSKGAFINTLASDERLHPEAIQTLVDAAQSDDADVVVGQGYSIAADGTLMGPIDNAIPITYEDIVKLRKVVPLPFALMRREVIERESFSVDLVTCPDYLFWLRVFPRSKVVFIPDRIGDFRYHAESWSGDLRRATIMLEARFQAFRVFFKERPDLRGWRAEAEVGAYFTIVNSFYQAGQYATAGKWLLRSWSRHPLATGTYRDGILRSYTRNILRRGRPSRPSRVRRLLGKVRRRLRSLASRVRPRSPEAGR